MAKKLVKTLEQTFIKGNIYNFANGDELLPKEEYINYFENSDEEFKGEWKAMDRCKKTVKIVVKIYE